MDENEFEQSAVSPMSYFKIFFHRKEWFIVPVCLGIAAGICAGIVMPKKYKSSTVILVQEGKTDNPLFNKLAVSTTVSQRMSGIKESIMGWNSLVEVVKNLHLDKDVKTKIEFEKLVMGLRNNILIRLRGGNILNLTYIGDEPQKTRDVVENITNIFVNKNVEIQNRETGDAIRFIEEQLLVYKGKIKSAEIAQMQERLDELLIDSTKKHPMVKRLIERIDVKRVELEKENLHFTKSSDLKSQTNNQMIESIKKTIADLDGGVSQGMVFGQNNKNPSEVLYNINLNKVLARDVGVNEQLYATLLSRLETAKITQRLQASKEGTRYTVLDPPRVPLRHFKPNRVLLAIMGMFAGGVLGIGLIIVFEFFDKSFLDVEEAKNFLGVALFGAISKIHTVESVRREKQKYFWTYGLTVLFCIAVVGTTIVLKRYLLN